MTGFCESEVGDAALEWLHGPGRSIADGFDFAPGAPGAEPNDCGDVQLNPRLRAGDPSAQSRRCTT